MAKNIVVCCDGTNSQFDSSDTNVVHLYRALADDADQRAFYEPGVGTFGARVFGVNVGETLGKGLGAAFGYGITQNLVRAYRFLIETYTPGDRVFLFGFSRGAFAARSLAALIDQVGVLAPDDRDRAKEIVKAWLDGNTSVVARYQQPLTRCAPHFVGVWETVGALGVLIRLRRFHDNKLSPGVCHAVHALAIDEKRRKFEPTPWDESALKPGQHARQLWFVGVHSDVGGGYDERGLADITLAWMLEQAEAQGLALKPGAIAAIDGDATGRLHDSYDGLWPLLGRYVRHPQRDDVFHPSVGERLRRVADYTPDNVPADVRKRLAEAAGAD